MNHLKKEIRLQKINRNDQLYIIITGWLMRCKIETDYLTQQTQAGCQGWREKRDEGEEGKDRYKMQLFVF